MADGLAYGMPATKHELPLCIECFEDAIERIEAIAVSPSLAFGLPEIRYRQ